MHNVFINHNKRGMEGNPLLMATRVGVTSVCTNFVSCGPLLSSALVPEQLSSCSL